MSKAKLQSFLLSVLVWLVGLGILAWTQWPDGQFHLWMLDVGQGDALLIQTPHAQQILIDGGPTDQVLPQLGRHMPFWDRRIEMIILSHDHADHLAGLLPILERYQVDRVWMSGAIHTTPEYLHWVTLLRDKHISTDIVWAGKETTVDGVGLQVLFPLSDKTGIRPPNQHDATVVVRVDVADARILLTGDLEVAHERALLDAYCEGSPSPTACPELAANILKVPHHGSKSGSTADFLAAIRPSYALISAGARNSYGHPAPLTLQRLAAAQAKIFRTDQNGAVRVDIAPLRVTPERDPPK